MEIIPDEEDVTIDVIPLAVNSPRIVDWKIHKEGKKSYYQIIKADGKSHFICASSINSVTVGSHHHKNSLDLRDYGGLRQSIMVAKM
ncbi:hypothetical protein Tco_1284496 [Tanacetum coccineum]